MNNMPPSARLKASTVLLKVPPTYLVHDDVNDN